MKKRIITLSLLTIATAAAGVAIDINPAMAQGARFQFEPNTWGGQKTQKKHYQNFNPPTTNVGRGSMPHASAFLGVDPSMLKPAPKPQPVQPRIATNLHPTMSFGTPQAKIMPKPMTPQAFNPGFGAPMQNAPIVAQQPPQTAPQQQLANPSNSARSLSGRMVPRRNGNSHARSAVAGRLMKPKQPTGLAAQPKIASYGNNFFTPGSTKPTSSGYHSSSDVHGQVLNHR